MSILRRAALTSLYSIFTLSLLLFGILLSLKMVFGTASPLKHALHQSGIYTVVTRQIIDENKQQAGALPLQNLEVQNAIQKAFTPEQLEQATNQILDGTYAWLQGKTPTPQFNIDLTPAKQRMADYLGTYIQQRLDTLPVCASKTLPGSVDPFTATCLPAGFNKTAAIQQVKQEAFNNRDVVEQQTLTPATLQNSDGKTFTDQMAAMPRLYHQLMLAVNITGGVALLVAAGIVLLHPSRRAGARHIGVTVLTVGVVSGVVAWIASYVLGKASDNLNHTAAVGQLIQAKLVVVIRLLGDDLRGWLVGYGVFLATVGAATLVVLAFLKKKYPPAPGGTVHEDTPQGPPAIAN